MRGRCLPEAVSMNEVAKINGVEPFAYLKATLEAIARGFVDRVDDKIIGLYAAGLTVRDMHDKRERQPDGSFWRFPD